MFKFGYSNKLVKTKKHLTLEATTTNLYSLLEQIAMKAGLRFKRVNNRILVIKEGKKRRKSFGAPVVQMGGIRGIISDEDTGEPIIGVSVGIKGSSKGTATVADFDRYEETRTTVDITGAYSFPSRKVKILAQARNVSNEPEAAYQGSESRYDKHTLVGRTYFLGLSLKF